MLKTVLFSLFSMCTAAGAQELYGAPPPPDAAFVRIVDAGAGVGLTTIANKQVVVPLNSSSDYQVAVAGSVDLAGEQTAIEAQKFYTLVIRADGEKLLMVDLAKVDRAKSVIEFFNLTDSPLDLAVAPGGPTVFEDIDVAASAFRGVNPSSVAFQVEGAAGVMAASGEISLERGSVYSIFAIPSEGSVELAIVKNAVAQN